jgi:hypothetical protein
MSKIIMRLCLPEPKVRKRTAKAVQKHKDKTKYTRKCKHRAAESGGLCFEGRVQQALRRRDYPCFSAVLRVSNLWGEFSERRVSLWRSSL